MVKGLDTSKFVLMGVLGVIALFLIVASSMYVNERRVRRLCTPGGAIVTLGGRIRTELATSSAARTLGLSGHAPLAADQGMLFVFDTPGTQRFWMKDMTFPLDIIWLDRNLRVLGVAENATPESYPKETFSSPENTSYVLELNAGQYAARKLQTGTQGRIELCR